MNNFVNTVTSQRNVSSTENGGKTFDTSKNKVVDFFFNVGAMRGQDVNRLTRNFEMAFQENDDLAVRTALYARDVRGGSGERQVFKDLMKYMEKSHPDTLEKVMPMVSELGRFDDLFVFETPRFKNQAYGLVSKALRDGNALAAKWTPVKGQVANDMRRYMNMGNPKDFRKFIVNLRKDVVERKMCANEWKAIEYGKVPSVAASRYQKAFTRHDEAGYDKYRQGLVAGTEKINTGAVYPYDVLKGSCYGDVSVSDAQWNALPNFLGDNGFILPMVDVSGSMYSPVGGYGSKNSLSMMDVALSLGLYLADKQSGPFKDMVQTFSGTSKIYKLSGSLSQKVNQMKRMDWAMNTNIEAAFEEILKVAKKGKVKKKEMPKYLLILSDMEFDHCTDRRSSFKNAKKKFKAAGYELPTIVFWNLQSRNDDNVPVKFNEKGVALVSGFSPSVVKSVLSAKTVTPYDIMVETLMVDRYNWK